MIKLCVFDLSGTIVDRFSLSPYISLKNCFKKHGININDSLIFKDMGKNKLDHINEILNDKYVARNWFQLHKKYPGINESQQIYNDFNYYQINEGMNMIDILPETKKCIDILQKNNISTGVTTGFNKPITMNIRDKLIDNDIFIDKYVSSTCLGLPGRPYPHMINNIMNSISLKDPTKVIKIDDTVIGLKEGKMAGCITIGVAKWSTYMYMKEKNASISKEEYVEKLKNSREILYSAKPDYVINSLDELYPIIHQLNQGFSRNFRIGNIRNA